MMKVFLLSIVCIFIVAADKPSIMSRVLAPFKVSPSKNPADTFLEQESGRETLFSRDDVASDLEGIDFLSDSDLPENFVEDDGEPMLDSLSQTFVEAQKSGFTGLDMEQLSNSLESMFSSDEEVVELIVEQLPTIYALGEQKAKSDKRVCFDMIIGRARDAQDITAILSRFDLEVEKTVEILSLIFPESSALAAEFQKFRHGCDALSKSVKSSDQNFLKYEFVQFLNSIHTYSIHVFQRFNEMLESPQVADELFVGMLEQLQNFGENQIWEYLDTAGIQENFMNIANAFLQESEQFYQETMDDSSLFIAGVCQLFFAISEQN